MPDNPRYGSSVSYAKQGQFEMADHDQQLDSEESSNIEELDDIEESSDSEEISEEEGLVSELTRMGGASSRA